MVKRRFEIDAESRPDLAGMMLVTIHALKNLGGSATIQELDEKVVELEGVTEAEQAFTMPDENRTRVNYYLSWARTYLKRGNALVNSSRGVWALTEDGAAIRGLDEIRAIRAQVTQEERERTRAKRQAAKGTKPDIVESTDNNPEEAEDWKSSSWLCWAPCRRMRLSGCHNGSCAKRGSPKSKCVGNPVTVGSTVWAYYA